MSPRDGVPKRDRPAEPTACRERRNEFRRCLLGDAAAGAGAGRRCRPVRTTLGWPVAVSRCSMLPPAATMTWRGAPGRLEAGDVEAELEPLPGCTGCGWGWGGAAPRGASGCGCASRGGSSAAETRSIAAAARAERVSIVLWNSEEGAAAAPSGVVLVLVLAVAVVLGRLEAALLAETRPRTRRLLGGCNPPPPATVSPRSLETSTAGHLGLGPACSSSVALHSRGAALAEPSAAPRCWPLALPVRVLALPRLLLLMRMGGRWGHCRVSGGSCRRRRRPERRASVATTVRWRMALQR
mmetsp:Transcript_3408/g.14055  ORF Transcript_3408/g.14055 Transcript_3408/m.14055 type:complete len:297 (-) Transcript_3408:564-1454(-)